MFGFLDAYKSSDIQGVTEALETFDLIEPYVVTNCTDTALSSLFNKFKGYQFGEVITPEGENVKGETYMEFHIDEDALLELTLQLLYEPK
jgi:hypothetical protein